MVGNEILAGSKGSTSTAAVVCVATTDASQSGSSSTIKRSVFPHPSQLMMISRIRPLIGSSDSPRTITAALRRSGEHQPLLCERFLAFLSTMQRAPA